MATIHTRAARIFGTHEGGIRWPYGLEDANPRLRKSNPELYEHQRATQPLAQETIVEWAEKYGLKASSAGCCPHWLQRNVSRRCTSGPYSPPKCTKYGGNAVDGDWLDHSIAWIRDREPVALTSAPYSLYDEEHERIAWWLDEDERFRFTTGAGWYGIGTTQLVLWRADRVAVIEAAEAPVKPR